MLSPNCDLAELPRASQAWARAFPLAPPLPNFLADLSTAPRHYKWHSPSKNHRPAYLAMLAWLMRGGWVTQLCTFAYVVVWPEILYEVEYQLEADELRAQVVSSSSAASSSAATASAPAASRPTTADDNNNGGGGGDAEAEGSSMLSSITTTSSSHHHHHHHHHTESSPPVTSEGDDHSSSSPLSESRHTATIGEQVAEKARLERMADKASRQAAEKAAAHARKPVPVATPHPSINSAPHLAGLSPHVIVDAKKATGKDSLYLSAIGRRFGNASVGGAGAGADIGSGGGSGSGGDNQNNNHSHNLKVQKAWPVFWKYFNGRSALERVALQEDMKRKEAWNLLTAMSEYLLCVRHW